MTSEPRYIPGLKRLGCLLGGIGAVVISILFWILKYTIDGLVGPTNDDSWGGPGLLIFLGGVFALVFLLIGIIPASLSGIAHAWILGRLAQRGRISLRSGLFAGVILCALWGTCTFAIYNLLFWWLDGGRSVSPDWKYALPMAGLFGCVGLLQGWLLVRYIRGAHSR